MSFLDCHLEDICPQHGHVTPYVNLCHVAKVEFVSCFYYAVILIFLLPLANCTYLGKVAVCCPRGDDGDCASP